MTPSLVAADGLHPSKLQYTKWVDAIIPRLQFDKALFSPAPEEVPDDPVSVYPNPAVSNLKVDSREEIRRVGIFDDSGRKVYDQIISSLPVEIDLSNLVPGIYVIWVYHGKEDAVFRSPLIIQ